MLNPLGQAIVTAVSGAAGYLFVHFGLALIYGAYVHTFEHGNPWGPLLLVPAVLALGVGWMAIGTLAAALRTVLSR